VPYLSALEVRSRRGAKQIHVYLYLYLYVARRPDGQNGGAANAGVENAGVDSRSGKYRSDNVWKAVKQKIRILNIFN